MTREGRDYLKGVSIAIILSTLLDIRIAIALTFALSASALISLILFIRSFTKSLEITIDPSYLKTFKGDDELVAISLRSPLSRWMTVGISHIMIGAGVETRIREMRRESIEISFTPKYAGRFSSPKVALELVDMFGFFAQSAQTDKVDLVIDSLPYSLLSPVNKPRIFPLSLGEKPTNLRGLGQEFYGIDEYSPFTDSKDILWKRISRNPDRLAVKVRASNIPHLVKIGLIECVSRGEDRIKWMDLVCEGIGTCAKTFLSFGCKVDILYHTHEGISVTSASSHEELTESIMEASVGQSSTEGALEIAEESDIIVTGMQETEDTIVAKLLADKPVLLIEERSSPLLLGKKYLVFSGEQDVTSLTSLVINR